MKHEISTQSAEGSELLSKIFEGHEVRTFIDDAGHTWACAQDVCEILGYQNPARDITRHCRAEGVLKRYTLTAGGRQEILFLNEPNLLRLVIKSNKPNAERFEAWVFETLLPRAVRNLPTHSAATPARLSKVGVFGVKLGVMSTTQLSQFIGDSTTTETNKLLESLGYIERHHSWSGWRLTAKGGQHGAELLPNKVVVADMFTRVKIIWGESVIDALRDDLNARVGGARLESNDSK